MAIGSCVVDTNILLRMTRRADPEHQLVANALARLTSQGATLHYTHHILTLNLADFSRFEGLAPLHPNQV